jgi:uncharacterized protein (TIGR02001 family)
MTKFAKLLLGAALISGAMLPAAVQAQDTSAPPTWDVSGSIGIVSQYRFRGISLSDENIAVQGGLTLSHASGFYGGTWLSNLDGFGELGGSNLEVDLFAGYKTEVASGTTLDAGVLYYAYPGSNGTFEFFEPYASITTGLGPATVKLGTAFAWSQKAIGNNSNIYVYLDPSIAIPDTPVTLKAHIGYSDGNTALSPTGSYVDYMVGADLVYQNLTFSLSYVDTNLTARENRLFVDPSRNITDGAVLVGLTASF